MLTPTKFDTRTCLYPFVIFLFSLFRFTRYTDLSNLLPGRFHSFGLVFAGKVMTGTNDFVSLMVEIILLVLSASTAAKT